MTNVLIRLDSAVDRLEGVNEQLSRMLEERSAGEPPLSSEEGEDA